MTLKLSPDSTKAQVDKVADVGVAGEGDKATWCQLREPHPLRGWDPEARDPHLISVIREVDLVENLGGFVLDGLHLHQVRRVLPGPISENGQGRGRSEGGPTGPGNRGKLGDKPRPDTPPHFQQQDRPLDFSDSRVLYLGNVITVPRWPRALERVNKVEGAGGLCRVLSVAQVCVPTPCTGRAALSTSEPPASPTVQNATVWLASKELRKRSPLLFGHPHPQGAGPTNPVRPRTNPAPAAPVPQGFLEPLQAVDGEWAVLAGLQEALHVGQENVARWEEASAEPEQLPAPLLAVPVGGGPIGVTGTCVILGPHPPVPHPKDQHHPLS